MMHGGGSVMLWACAAAKGPGFPDNMINDKTKVDWMNSETFSAK